MSMSQITLKIKTEVDVAMDNPNLEEAKKAPAVFRDRDQQAAPSQLAEWATYIAARREFVAEVMQSASHTLALVDVMLEALRESNDDELNAKLAENAPALINRGFAAQERMAHAKVSLVEASVDYRAAKMQRDRLAATVKQIEHVHREWRNAEFTLDRMIRLTQLRLQMSET
jgi:hypothetical protein